MSAINKYTKSSKPLVSIDFDRELIKTNSNDSDVRRIMRHIEVLNESLKQANSNLDPQKITKIDFSDRIDRLLKRVNNLFCRGDYKAALDLGFYIDHKYESLLSKEQCFQSYGITLGCNILNLLQSRPISIQNDLGKYKDYGLSNTDILHVVDNSLNNLLIDFTSCKNKLSQLSKLSKVKEDKSLKYFKADSYEINAIRKELKRNMKMIQVMLKNSYSLFNDLLDQNLGQEVIRNLVDHLLVEGFDLDLINLVDAFSEQNRSIFFQIINDNQAARVIDIYMPKASRNLKGFNSIYIQDKADQLYFTYRARNFFRSLVSGKKADLETLKRYQDDGGGYSKAFKFIRYIYGNREKEGFQLYANMDPAQQDSLIEGFKSVLKSCEGYSSGFKAAIFSNISNIIINLEAEGLLQDELFNFFQEIIPNLSSEALEEILQNNNLNVGLTLTNSLQLLLAAKKELNQESTVDENTIDPILIDFSFFEKIESEPLMLSIFAQYTSYLDQDIDAQQVRNVYEMINIHNSSSFIIDIYELIGVLPLSGEKLHLLIQSALQNTDYKKFDKIVDQIEIGCSDLLTKNQLEIYQRINFGEYERDMLDQLDLSEDSLLHAFSNRIKEHIEYEGFKEVLCGDISKNDLIEFVTSQEPFDLISYVTSLSNELVKLNDMIRGQAIEGRSPFKDSKYIKLNQILTNKMTEASNALKILGQMESSDQQFIIFSQIIPLLDEYDRSLLEKGIENGFRFYSRKKIPSFFGSYLTNYVDVDSLKKLAMNVGKKISTILSSLDSFFEEYAGYLKGKEVDLSDNPKWIKEMQRICDFVFEKEELTATLLKALVFGWEEAVDLERVMNEVSSVKEIIELTFEVEEELKAHLTSEKLHKIRNFNINLSKRLNIFYKTLYCSLEKNAQIELCEALYHLDQVEPLFEILLDVDNPNTRQQELLYDCWLCVWIEGIDVGLSEVYPFNSDKSLKLSNIQFLLEKFEACYGIKEPILDNLSIDSSFDFASLCRWINKNPEKITNVKTLSFLITAAQKQGRNSLVFNSVKQINIEQIYDVDILLTLLILASGSNDSSWFNKIHKRVEKILSQSSYTSSKFTTKEIQALLNELSPESFDIDMTAFSIAGEFTTLSEQLRQIQLRNRQDTSRPNFQISSKAANSSQVKNRLQLSQSDKESILIIGAIKPLLDDVFDEMKYFEDRDQGLSYLEDLFTDLKYNKEKILNAYQNNSIDISADYSLEDVINSLNNPVEILNYIDSFIHEDDVHLDLKEFDDFQVNLIKKLPSGPIIDNLLCLKSGEVASLFDSLISNAMGNTRLNQVLQYFGPRQDVNEKKIHKFLKEMNVTCPDSSSESGLYEGLEGLISALKSVSFNVRYIETAAKNYNKMKGCLERLERNEIVPDKQRLTLEEFGSFEKLQNLIDDVVDEFKNFFDFEDKLCSKEINVLAYAINLDIMQNDRVNFEKLVPEGHFQVGDILLENENKFAQLNKKSAWNLEKLFKGKSLFECLMAIIGLFKGLAHNVFEVQTAFTGKYMHASIIIKDENFSMINAEVIGNFEKDAVSNEAILTSEHYRPNFIKLLEKKSIHLLERIIEKEKDPNQGLHQYIGSIFKDNLNFILEANGENLEKLVNSPKRAAKSIFYHFPILGYFLRKYSQVEAGYKIEQENEKDERKMFCSEFVSEAFLLAIELTNKDLRDKLKKAKKIDIGLKKALEGIDIDSDIDFLINPIPDGVLPKSINPTRLQNYIQPYFTRIAPPRILRELIQAKELAIE